MNIWYWYWRGVYCMPVYCCTSTHVLTVRFSDFAWYIPGNIFQVQAVLPVLFMCNQNEISQVGSHHLLVSACTSYHIILMRMLLYMVTAMRLIFGRLNSNRRAVNRIVPILTRVFEWAYQKFSQRSAILSSGWRDEHLRRSHLTINRWIDKNRPTNGISQQLRRCDKTPLQICKADYHSYFMLSKSFPNSFDTPPKYIQNRSLFCFGHFYTYTKYTNR